MVTHSSTERVQKLLARSGLGSRREIETWIKAGRVTVDGHLAQLGDRASLQSVIHLDGKPIASLLPKTTLPRVLLYHKPIGEICSKRDTASRKTVFEALPALAEGRWVMVGRLDVNTSGLLLFTTDGELAHRLMHPAQQIEREYLVRVFGIVTPEMLKKLKNGVVLDDGLARFQSIVAVRGEHANQWFKVTLAEGRNRIVRRLWLSQGVKINRLTRIRFGSIQLPNNLKPGQYKELNATQIKSLLGSM